LKRVIERAIELAEKKLKGIEEAPQVGVEEGH
jgi:hypothetical protein